MAAETPSYTPLEEAGTGTDIPQDPSILSEMRVAALLKGGCTDVVLALDELLKDHPGVPRYDQIYPGQHRP